MTISRLTLLATAMVALSVAGCANGTSSEVGAAAPSAPAASASSAVPTEEPSAQQPTAGGSRTITGTVTAGVEANCLLVDDHLLIFDDEKLKATAKAGAEVTVTGRTEPGMMTTCMQGTPFIVTAIRAK
ncbi:hypothetical protein AB0J80_37220 [Actinoplanes sp. NPDC049548]|uniref:hypothetical protein n=1 Tax=Actinoplanes sp. NPDC049548 TaxID=3155152 RepID=UPI00343A700B